MFTFLSNITGGSTDSAILIYLAIVLCAFLLEDLATVVVGLLVADGVLQAPTAFISLYIGIVLGDAFFYSAGALARTHQRLATYINHDFTFPFRSWLERKYAFNIFSGHFIPGMRSSTYIASGFFRLPLSTFIPMAMAGGLVLLTTYFTLSYLFGSVTSEWIGHARWGIAVVFVLTIFFIGRHNLLKYRVGSVELEK
jgi:membrane protein DedA with SNARE-associated domain